MVFSSLTFIYFFLALTAVLYFPIKNRTWRNIVLLVFSLIFYSWGEPKLVLLMLAVAFVAYEGAILMTRLQGKAQTAAFVTTVVLITLNLVVFKYLGFLASPWAKIEIALPIGISFYTFQILSYVIDLKRGKVQLQKNYFTLLLYVCFFPQLIAGPIVRYSTVEDELANRQENFEDILAGTRRFILGLAKKALLANSLAQIAEIIYASKTDMGSLMYWLAAAAYSLQIYFDFSGYSDMAIGLGRIFGFHFLENFNHPYIATSITDFWRRWHISLSGWFRDYIYIPLGGKRVSAPRRIFNLLVVWGLTGFWHGADWNFIIWGLYYGVLLILEKYLLGKYLEKLPKFIGWLYTAFIVSIGWVIFNITDLAQLGAVLGKMFAFSYVPVFDVIAANIKLATAFIYIPLGIVCMLPLGEYISRLGSEDKEWKSALINAFFLALFVLSTAKLMSTNYNPFIYFRF